MPATTNRGWPLILGLSIVLVGCRETPEGVPVHPVSGEVRVDGTAAAGAEVSFHPLSPPPPGTPPTVAVVDQDGHFQASTRAAGDGAPEGEYRLTIIWRTASSSVPDDAGGGGDRLQGRYAQPETSGLRAVVRARENVLPPIELKAARTRR